MKKASCLATVDRNCGKACKKQIVKEVICQPNQIVAKVLAEPLQNINFTYVFNKFYRKTFFYISRGALLVHCRDNFVTISY